MLHDRALIRRATPRSHAKPGIFSGKPPDKHNQDFRRRIEDPIRKPSTSPIMRKVPNLHFSIDLVRLPLWLSRQNKHMFEKPTRSVAR